MYSPDLENAKGMVENEDEAIGDVVCAHELDHARSLSFCCMTLHERYAANLPVCAVDGAWSGHSFELHKSGSGFCYHRQQ